MAKTRLQLQSELESITGLSKVYYQPPESVKLKYDCVIYNSNPPQANYADDIRYLNHKRYELTLISRDPECAVADILLSKFKYIDVDRIYASDNLYHWIFTLFY